MIELDGSTGEGGGQILRSALALSMCTGQAFTIKNIRAKRSKPGLMRQHLTCVKAALEISDAQAQGAELGSQHLVFKPNAVKPGNYQFSIGSAGSCTLVLQTILPALMLCQQPSQISLSGGTHNSMAPPYHFLERSFVPLVAKLGVQIKLELHRLGFYPAGGGQFLTTITPATNGLHLIDVVSRGAPIEHYSECLTPGLPHRVAIRELQALGELLSWSKEQLRVMPVRNNEGPGNALMVSLVYQNITEMFTAFGERGLKSEQVAAAAAQQVQAYLASDAPLGTYLADQWMLPIALALAQASVQKGQTVRFRCTDLSEHSRTNMQTIQQFLPVKFESEAQAGSISVTLKRC